MGFFILVFLVLAALEFFLVTRPGRARFFAVIPPASALFFWLDRQSYWTAADPSHSVGSSLELMLVGTWAAGAIVGAVAGLIWNRKRGRG